MRLRAHTDEETRRAAHRFVMNYFGGDYQRALWCLDECGKMDSITGEGARCFPSVAKAASRYSLGGTSDNWTAHLVMHLIGFFIFTMPVMYGLTLLLDTPFLPALPWIALGSAITVIVLGVAKYGMPGRFSGKEL